MFEFFSLEKKFGRLSKKFQQAVSSGNQNRAMSLLTKIFWLLLDNKEAKRLSDFVVLHLNQIEDANTLEKGIYFGGLNESINLLENSNFQSAAIVICDFFGYETKAVEILARQGSFEDIQKRVIDGKKVNKKLLERAIEVWEVYHGDIRKNRIISKTLKMIAKIHIENLPRNPRVYETIRKFKEAGDLYLDKGAIEDAASCYEKAKMFEKALEITKKPERKINLLIQLEWFNEAKEFAEGLESPEKFFVQIRENAREKIDARLKESDFIGAIELVDVADLSVSRREEILSLVRRDFENRLSKKFQQVVSSGNPNRAMSLFSKVFWFLLDNREAKLLSDFVFLQLYQIEDANTLEKRVSPVRLNECINLLENSNFQSAAIVIRDLFEYETKAVGILARQGFFEDIQKRVIDGKKVNKKLLERAIEVWELYHGDIRENLIISKTLNMIAKIHIESLPCIPRVHETVGRFKEAGALYLDKGAIEDAASCYEKAKMFERALEITKKPERKINLLIQLEWFNEAKEFAEGLESPEKFFVQIRENAREKIDARLKESDFIGAIELVDVADLSVSRREEILSLVRRDFEVRLINAKSDEDILKIYWERVFFEEKAGNFTEAGIIAEETLKDFELASRLYEKANLFNRAIDQANQDAKNRKDSKEAKLWLAGLQEKGGNLLCAAGLYECLHMYEKASEIYERTMHFKKAIACYLKVEKCNKDVLIRLYMGAGEFEKIIDIYMEPGDLYNMEKALSIAKTHHLEDHERSIQNKIDKFISGKESDLKKYFNQAMKEVSNSYSSIYGIDFGTTNSVVTIFNKTKKKVEIIPSSCNTELEPSYFGLDKNNRPVFGEKARERAQISPKSVVARVKRKLGKPDKFTLGGKEFKCEEIAARIIETLKSNAEKFLLSKITEKFYFLLNLNGIKFPGSRLEDFLKKQKCPVYMKEVVLTVPAYFNDNQKKATKDAAEIAGLNVNRLIHEPTAAALAYGYKKPFSGKVMVIDLGGGTMDISILDVEEGIYEVQNIGGDTNLGGSDIDEILLNHVIKNLNDSPILNISKDTHPVEVARLRDACENLKINLSSLDRYSMELMNFLNSPLYTFRMSRAELEKLAKPVLDRIESRIIEILKKTGERIDSLLVGNAAKMPAVLSLVKKRIKGKHLGGIDPGTVVAEGAALQGAILSRDLPQTLLIDIVPYNLGIEVIGDKKTKDPKVKQIIYKNSKIPIKKSEICTTLKDYQPNVHIKVFQGETDKIYQNHFLGDFILDGIPPASAGVPKIEVTFDIDVNCILTVTAVDKGTNRSRSIKIEHAFTLSPVEKKKIKSLLTETQNIVRLEEDLKSIRSEIEALKTDFESRLKSSKFYREIFLEEFHEKIEINPNLYIVTNENIKVIQEMIVKKDQLNYESQRIIDQYKSLDENLKFSQKMHLDFSAKDIGSKLKKRIDILSKFKRDLLSLISRIEEKIFSTLFEWVNHLKSIPPNFEKMNHAEATKYYLKTGDEKKAKEILDSLLRDENKIKMESFKVILNEFVYRGWREEYRVMHKHFGNSLNLVYPDFNQLNQYLKEIEESIFLIRAKFKDSGYRSCNGFCIAPKIIVTTRSVVEGLAPSDIRVIGVIDTDKREYREYNPVSINLDPDNDFAIIRIIDEKKSLRIGEFNFVQPGEQVLATGFISSDNNLLPIDISISKGTVNSIRDVEHLGKRVIFTDVKVSKGMIGSPLINDLGEVIGIITFIKIKTERMDKKDNANIQKYPMNNLDKEYDLLSEKLFMLKEAKIKETDASVKFKYIKEIEEIEAEMLKIQKELQESGQTLSKIAVLEEQPVAMPINLVHKYL